MEHELFNPISFNKEVQIDSGFAELIKEINESDIQLPHNPVILVGEQILDSISLTYELERMDDQQTIDGSIELKIEKGYDIAQNEAILIAAYDESIAYYSTLEGKLAYISHSLLFMRDGAYYPLNKLSVLFCTSSSIVHKKINGSILATKWDVDTTINVEIAKQKGRFITENSYKNTILLIDGPLIAGDGLAYFQGSVNELVENNIIPIFIVKNSMSDVIIKSNPKLKEQYNSDLHYINETLSEGYRTVFYKYTNTDSPDKTKVFCYIKHKNHHSPIRVEMPTMAFIKNRDSINPIMDLIFYLIKVQGNLTNPQVRPIAVAEMYARETIKLINFKKDSIQYKLTPTMNEERGMF